MASSSLALKKFVSSNLVPKSLLSTRQAIPAAQSASRLFNTNAVPDIYWEEDDDDDRSLHAARRKSNLSTFQGKFAPKTFSGLRCCLYVRETARETEDGLYLRMDMPGFDKENTKIVVEHNTLTIKGENGEESGEDDSGQRYYSNRIDLADKVYRIDQIKAEMKNGVLKVVVPKVKDERSSDNYFVTIEYKNRDSDDLADQMECSNGLRPDQMECSNGLRRTKANMHKY